MRVSRIDHLVLTVADIDRTVDFYTRVLGMKKIEFAQGRIAPGCGEQKINLHQLGKEFEPRAEHVRAGSADLCLIIDTPIEQAIEHIQQHEVELKAGPVKRTGAKGKIISAYLRAPDGNLLEVSNYI